MLGFWVRLQLHTSGKNILHMASTKCSAKNCVVIELYPFLLDSKAFEKALQSRFVFKHHSFSQYPNFPNFFNSHQTASHFPTEEYVCCNNKPFMCDSSHQILALRLGEGASLKSKTEQAAG